MINNLHIILFLIETRTKEVNQSFTMSHMQWTKGINCTLVMYQRFLWCCFYICGLQTGGTRVLVAYEDYAFIPKMKMTEVSNPMRRKQKRLGMSSNSFDLKNIRALWQKCSATSRRQHGLHCWRKQCDTKEDRMNFSPPKTFKSLTAECSLPPFLSWSQAILLDPKILRVDLTTKFHFQSQWPISTKKDSWKCLLYLLFSLSPFYYTVWACIWLLGLFLKNPEPLTWPEWEMSPIHSPWKEHLWWRSVCLSFSPWRAAGENIYHHSPQCR